MPKHVITSITVGVNTIDIRPHEADVRSDAYLGLIKPTRLLSFQPHMHNRGKAECLEAIYPSGKTEMLENCARFELLNWMRNYVYADDAAPLAACWDCASCHHVARQQRPEQIQPRSGRANDVGGERTIDEMRLGLVAQLLLHVRRRTSKKRPKSAKPKSARSQVRAMRTRVAAKMDFLQGRKQFIDAACRLFLPTASPGCNYRRLPLERSGISYPGSPIPQGAGCKSHVSPGWESNADGSFSMWFGYLQQKHRGATRCAARFRQPL